MGPTIAVGSAKAHGSKAKSAESRQTRPEQRERGMKRQKGWPAVGTSGTPSRFPSRPFVWARIEPSGFSARNTQERCMKPPGPDLIGGWALAPV
jgi:hypothetical protein